MASNTKIAIALIFIAALMAANTAVAVRDLQETEVIAAPAFNPIDHGRNLLGTEASKLPATKSPVVCTKSKGPLGVNIVCN